MSTTPVKSRHIDLSKRRVTAPDSRFVSVLAHEIKTPLTVILGMSRMACTKWEKLEPEQLRELTEAICRNAERLNNLTQNALAMVIPRASQPHATRLVDAIQSAVNENHGFPWSPEVIVEVSEALEVQISAAHLRTVLKNLLSNAEIYGSEGSPIGISASRSLSSNGPMAEILVSNEGDKIPKWQQEVIFEPYSQPDDFSDTRVSKGLGLGLFVVHTLLEHHQGSIELVPEAPLTTFRVMLPLVSERPHPGQG